MASEITSPVPLSTPDNHIFLDTEPTTVQSTGLPVLPDDQFRIKYDIERTLDEIRQNDWRKVALQFPDEMLKDSARVYQMLARGHRQKPLTTGPESTDPERSLEHGSTNASVQTIQENSPGQLPLTLTILADTSFGSCCVDEIAAEHVDADAVIHYGRSCLSPTSRLPVLYIYTNCVLDHDLTVHSFLKTFPDKTEKVIVMADVPYSHHVEDICDILRRKQGYENIHNAEIHRDIGGLIPNRKLPLAVANASSEDMAREQLKSWSIFHISDPPTTLLLTLESRVKAVHVLPTQERGQDVLRNNTAQILRRRYALITSLGTVSTWGILINTLSVKNYLHIVDHVKQQIADAGKKSYLFVVGKLNPAKVANFADIGGWVVIGCWESSLIDSRDFYRPIITPFELTLVLRPDEDRVWTGEWRGDFQSVLDQTEKHLSVTKPHGYETMPGAFLEDDEAENSNTNEDDSDEESEPPEFDLRTGKYVSRTRPMRSSQTHVGIQQNGHSGTSTALTKRANGDIVAVNGIASPAAEYLAQQRSWRGLGSDFEIKYDNEEEQGSLIEEGKTGVARGYTTGGSQRL